MIFTIGYEQMRPEAHLKIARTLDALVIDVRSVPRSRKPGWSKSGLIEIFGEHHYAPMGALLGGRPPGVLPAGVDAITRSSQEREVILMCMEEAPGHCHRRHTICGPHFPNAIHIYQDELLRARDLTSAVAADDYYTQIGSLFELVKNPKKVRKLLRPAQS